MTRARAIVTRGRGEALSKTVVETLARGKVEPKLEVVLVERHYLEVIPVEQHPVLESFTRGGGATVTPRNSQTRERAQTHEHQQAPVIQDAVKQPPVDPMVWNDLAPVVGGQVALPIVLTEDEQRKYEKFRKMDPPQFQGGKSEYTYEFLTTCRELLEALQEMYIRRH
ncbi:hypothetical protein KY289_026701 [Solanum tuberosum]|nr:hypothetical protein KY289_026701 [Solanum tuberosum]